MDVAIASLSIKLSMHVSCVLIRTINPMKDMLQEDTSFILWSNLNNCTPLWCTPQRRPTCQVCYVWLYPHWTLSYLWISGTCLSDTTSNLTKDMEQVGTSSNSAILCSIYLQCTPWRRSIFILEAYSVWLYPSWYWAWSYQYILDVWLTGATYNPIKDMKYVIISFWQYLSLNKLHTSAVYPQQNQKCQICLVLL